MPGDGNGIGTGMPQAAADDGDVHLGLQVQGGVGMAQIMDNAGYHLRLLLAGANLCIPHG